MVLIILVVIFLIIEYSHKWQNEYYFGEMLVDARNYGEWNPFKKPLRKIYRPKKPLN